MFQVWQIGPSSGYSQVLFQCHLDLSHAFQEERVKVEVEERAESSSAQSSVAGLAVWYTGSFRIV